MKILQTFFLSAATTVFLAACNPPTPPVIVEPPVVVGQTTYDLSVTVTGVAGAPVKVLNAAGEIKFDATVTGSKTLSALPKGKYTVTGGTVANFAAPAAQTADLSAGNGAVTLAYVALPGSALATTTVSGVIPDWKLGKASVALAHVFTSDGRYSRFSELILPKGTIAADGTLSIILPDTIDASYLSYAIVPPLNDTSCSFTGTATDREVKTDWYARRLVQIGDSPLGYVQEYLADSPASSRHIVGRVYSTADSVIKGTVVCQATPYSAAYKEINDLTLSKGWNIVEAYIDSDGSFHYVTLAAGTRVSLAFQSFAPEVRVALNNPSVQLKRGERVTTGATITQIGGYSGTVSLSTNVPGVTVEPATLKLSPVTTQGLTAQALNDPWSVRRQEVAQAVGAASVSASLTFVASADAAEHGYTSGDQLLLKDADGTALGSASLSVTVSVPSVTGSLGGVALDRGQTTAAYVYFYSSGGYTGPVTASLQNLPAGVSAPDITKTVSNGYTSVPLNFTVSSSAVPGTTSAQLVVNAGGMVTKSDVQVTVNKPSVSVSFANYNALTVHRGQTQNLSVQVSGQHSFSGSTTISLSGLPIGVIAAPLTVTITPGAVTNATVAVTASASATYGNASVKVTGADVETSSQAQLFLTVASSITVTPSEAVRIATAGNGIWTISQNGQYVSTGSASGYNYTFQRYEDSQLKASATLLINGGINSAPLTTPSGDLIVFVGNDVYIIKADGTTSSVVGDSGTAYYAKVVDAQNRVWYVGYGSGNAATLNTLDLSTGAKTVVTGVTPSDTYFRMYRNATGSTLYLIPNSSYATSTVLTQIDSATSTKIKDITLPGVSSISSLAIAQDGVIWGGSSYASVFRVNADGTVTTFSSLTSSSKLVFDAVNPKILWSYSSSAVDKIDTTTVTAVSIPVGSGITDIAADNGGGVWAGGSEYNYSSGSNSYYLSLIK